MPKSLNRVKSALYMRSAAVILPLFFFTACTTNNVTVDDGIRRYFDSAAVKGDFGLFDNGQGHFTIYNLNRFRDSGYSPGATFDIVQSLIAIQTGVLKDDNSKPMDTLPTLRQAFQGNRLGTVSFLNLALRLGPDTLKKWIDSLHYGNRDTSGGYAGCWEDNHLKITADEQLGLIKKLYFDQLPFFKRSQEIVRGMMPAEKNSQYTLAYKTGRVDDEKGHAQGWVVGWVEENKHPYFFVLNLESADTTARLDTIGLHMVKEILRPMGFFAGKK